MKYLGKSTDNLDLGNINKINSLAQDKITSELSRAESPLKNALDNKQDNLSAEQLAAANSGINSNKVTNYDAHIINTNNPHSVTYTQTGAAAASHTHNNADLVELANWAKQENKPTYTYSEVGAAQEIHTHLSADITDSDSVPTANSTHLVQSGGVKSELDKKIGKDSSSEGDILMGIDSTGYYLRFTEV